MAQLNGQWLIDNGEMAERIRRFDWAGTSLGASGRWPPSLRAVVNLILALPDPATIMCGPERIQLYNDAYIAIARERHPSLLGLPVAEGWPDVHATVIVPLLAETDAGRSVRLCDYAVVLRGAADEPERRIFNTTWSPFHDEAGAVAGTLQILTEVTEGHRVQAALQESGARLRAAFESVPVGVAVLDTTGRIVISNPEYQRFLPNGIMPSRDPERGWRWEAWDQQGRPIDPADFPGARAMRGEHVVPGQEMLHTCDDGREVWTRVAAVPIRAADGRITGQSSVISDIDVLKRSLEKLRGSEERHSLLLRLSDALRPLSDPVAVQDVATQLLGRHLGVSRAVYAEFMVEAGQQVVVIEREYRAPEAASFVGRHPAERFGPDVHELRAGRTIAVSDTEAENATEALKQVWRTLGVRARLGIPLIKDGRLVAGLGVHSADPRAWTDADIAMVVEIAERTWAAVERARAEAALRESEERLRGFGEASSDVLWIRDAETLQWSYLTPAFETIYGLDRETALREDNMAGWLDLIVPEDRQIALDVIRRVRAGERSSFEYRVRRPSDGQVRWMRDTDFPMHDAPGRVRWIGGVGRDITAEKTAIQRQEVLVNELQHRARNLLGVVTAVADRTLRQGGSVGAFEERLQALSRAQGLLSQAGSDTVEVGAMVRAELAAYAQDGSERISVDGPDVRLTARQVQNFALALHELTTNAVKYGALQDGAGRLTVTWEIASDKRGRHRLALTWVESEVAVDLGNVTRRGYGTELIQEALAYALEADVEYELGPGGVRCRIEMPIEQPG